MLPPTSSETPHGGESPKHAAPFPSADKVKDNMEKTGASPGQIDSALWLLDYAKTNKLPTFKAVAALIEREATTISKLFSGTYGADLKSVIRLIDRFRSILGERAGFGDRPIVETSVMEEVRTLCDLTRSSQTIAMLHGKNQSGKSTAIDSYALRPNHSGRTIVVRMPVGGGAKMFLKALARACGISDRKSYDELRDVAHRFFGYHAGQQPTRTDMLLIVDEVHQAMIGRTIRTVTMELIREIHDLCRIGVVLCGTDVLPEMIQDERFSRLLGQISNRGVLRRRIPAEPSARDVKLIVEAYGFENPTEGKALAIVKKIASESGIGKLCGYLRMAKKLANNRHQTADWKHFLTTHATLQSWERGDRGNGSKQIEDRSAE